MRMAASVCQVLAEIWLPRGARILRSLSSREARSAVVIAEASLMGRGNLYIQLRRSAEVLPSGQAIAAAGMNQPGPGHHLARAPGPPGQHQAGLGGGDLQHL